MLGTLTFVVIVVFGLMWIGGLSPFDMTRKDL